MAEKKLTIEQEELQQEFVKTYGLSPEQISFEGEKPEPIFDFDALSVLREKLTNFKAVDVSHITFDPADGTATAVCNILTSTDRTITVSDYAQIDETLPDGNKIATSISARRVARARAMRSGIRAAGVNILKAHKAYLETGEPMEFTPVNPRVSRSKEVHAIANEIGFIVGDDKTAYQKHIAELFDGRTSSADLDDLELQKLAASLRAIRRVKNATFGADDKKAA